jgi:hypothetical protein
MDSLVKLMVLLMSVGLQELMVEALVSLLTVELNRKELVGDKKSVMRLVCVSNRQWWVSGCVSNCQHGFCDSSMVD